MFSCVFFFKQKTAYELRISDWSSDVCSSDLLAELGIDSSYAPYAVDRNQFRPIGDRGQLSALRDRYEIPSGRYLIGSFQRDSVASDLVSPKLVKGPDVRSEEHTSELQSLMRISYAVFCLKKKNQKKHTT